MLKSYDVSCSFSLMLSLYPEILVFSTFACVCQKFHICYTICNTFAVLYDCHSLRGAMGTSEETCCFFVQGFHPEATHTRSCAWGLPDVSVRWWNDGNVVLSVTVKCWGGRGMWGKTACLHPNLHFWRWEQSRLFHYTEGRKAGALWKACIYPLSVCWKAVAVDSLEARPCDWLWVCVGVRDGVAFHRSQMLVSWWKLSILSWDRNHSCLVRSDVLNPCLIFMGQCGLVCVCVCVCCHFCLFFFFFFIFKA